jgi:hypothetical protein
MRSLRVSRNRIDINTEKACTVFVLGISKAAVLSVIFSGTRLETKSNCICLTYELMFVVNKLLNNFYLNR